MTGIAYYVAGITSAMVGATVTVLVSNLKVPQMTYPMLIAMILPTGVIKYGSIGSYGGCYE